MPDIEKALQKLDSEFPPKPILRFKPVKGKGGLFDSKLGGTPYFPKDMEYPKGTDGDYKDRPLRLLAQLNFEQLPHIENFPEKGILQIFIACENDAVYGFDIRTSEDQIKQNGFRVVYHENIITDTSKLMTDEDIPYSEFSEDEDDFPIKHEFILKAEKPEKCLVRFDDFKAEERFPYYYNEDAEEIEDVINTVHDIEYETLKTIYDRNSEEICFIGGYPTFTQNDPRKYVDDFNKFNTVLFELCSMEGNEMNKWGGHNYDIIWGDVGTGCFLISAEALKKLDFSNVLYIYDCG